MGNFLLCLPTDEGTALAGSYAMHRNMRSTDRSLRWTSGYFYFYVSNPQQYFTVIANFTARLQSIGITLGAVGGNRLSFLTSAEGMEYHLQ